MAKRNYSSHRQSHQPLTDQRTDVPEMNKNSDGSLTLCLQKDSPGKDKEFNWLPAPDGLIYVVMRLNWTSEYMTQEALALNPSNPKKHPP